MAKMTTVTVRMDREDRQTLAQLEKAQKTAAAEVIRRLIREAAEKLQAAAA